LTAVSPELASGKLRHRRAVKDAFGQESFTEGVDPSFRGVLGLEFVAFNFRFDSSDASVIGCGILKRNLR
jgi:hypothetical protein